MATDAQTKSGACPLPELGPTLVEDAAGLSRPSRRCDTLLENGKDCGELVVRPNKRCAEHHHELEYINTSYKEAQEQYEAIDLTGDTATPQDRLRKIEMGKKEVLLRSRMNHRFHANGSAGNRGHIKWILKRQTEIEAMELACNLTEKSERSPTFQPATPVDKDGSIQGDASEKPVLRSRLSPTVPIESFDHLGMEHPVVILRKFLDELRQGEIRKLYAVAPSLDDRNSTVTDLDLPRPATDSDLDAGCSVIRQMLRGLIVYQADPETLTDASKYTSISAFLETRSYSVLHEFVRFFETFTEQRSDTLHFLRDAICDHLFAASSKSKTTILGADVIDEVEPRQLTVHGWDILYRCFDDFVNWSNVEAFCRGFEDVLLIKRLLALGRYGRQNGGEDGEHSWYNADNDVSQVNLLCLLLGFVPTSMSYNGPGRTEGTPQTTGEGKDAAAAAPAVEVQFRHYATGRMALSDPLAPALIREYKRRPSRYIMLVSEGPFGIMEHLDLESKKEELWLQKLRSVDASHPADPEWKISLSVSDILRDLGCMRWLWKEDIVKDYYHFVLVDRDAPPKPTIFDEVGRALARLKKLSSLDDLLSEVICKCIPENEQARCLAEASLQDDIFEAGLQIRGVNYERGRTRAWDVDRKFLQNAAKVVDEGGGEVILAVAEDMERHGVVSTRESYEPAMTMPRALRATDGRFDVYFPYVAAQAAPATDGPRGGQVLGADRGGAGDSLVDFARLYALRHPTAIFARGRLDTHYCAWPMSIVEGDGDSGGMKLEPHINFRTFEGHIYRWNFLPFDHPRSSELWHAFLHHYVHSKFDFVRFHDSTFVVCADNERDATEKRATLYAEAKKRSWEVSVAHPSRWSSDVSRLHLESAWHGLYPAYYKRTQVRGDCQQTETCDAP